MIRRVFLTLSGLGLLAGCGFRLRGTADSMGQIPEVLRIEATDPYSSIVQKITQKFTHQGVQIVSASSAPTLKLTLPKESKRILGPVSDSGDQTELALEMSYNLTSQDHNKIVPETEVRVTLVYIESGSATSADQQSIAQLKRSLEDDLALQVVASIRVRYEQAVKQSKRSKTK
tara:strand:+ start:1433 stop:1954 length:522 start_codon:yes stop_codon:yes gene_type:complete